MDGTSSATAYRTGPESLSTPDSAKTRRWPLRRRFLVAIALLVSFVFAVLALVLTLTGRRQLRSEIETHALNHAALATNLVSEAYATYYFSGYSKFRELAADAIGRNTDLARVALYDTNGVLLFDSSELAASDGAPRAEPGPATDDPELARAVRALEPTAWRTEGEDGKEQFLVVVPHVEEWGRHRYSVAYWASYDSLGPATRRMLVRLLGPILASLALGFVIAVVLARQNLEPLEKLAAGARDLARGRLERRLDLQTGDEFEALADTFNDMAERLAVTIHDLENSNEALARSNVHLREIDRMKSDLLANVSHELRTPLTALRGYNEALSEELLGPVSEAQREALDVSSRNLDRLLDMIDGLLTYARLESGAIEIERESMDLGALAREAVADLEATRARGVRVGVEVPADLPEVFGDPKRLRQVLDNLIENAVKFTAEGRRVMVRLRRRASQVEIEVEDEGIGIPEEEQARIFERFYQVDSSSTRAFGGIGLGLSIVRQILDAHGTGIEVDSELGRGSTFRFWLPLAADMATAGEGRDVVIVDDDAEWTRRLAGELREHGWRVRSTDSCAGASKLVRESTPSAVVLDRLLGDGDGFDLLADWRVDPGLREVPVLVVSVRNDEPLARRLGATDYLVKPVAPAVAAERLLGWLDAEATSEADAASSDETTEDTIPEEIV